MEPTHQNRPVQGLAAIWQITAQELRSSLRDRQTVMNSVVLPIVMYPILLWIILQGFLVVQGHKERTQVEVALVGEPAAVQDLLDEFNDLDESPEGAETDKSIVYVTDLALDSTEEALRSAMEVEPTAETESQPDAILRVPSEEGATVTLFVESTRSDSELASERIQRLTGRLSKDLRKRDAKSKGFSPSDLDPIDITSHQITAERDQGAFVLSLFLPMMIVFMAVM